MLLSEKQKNFHFGFMRNVILTENNENFHETIYISKEHGLCL